MNVILHAIESKDDRSQPERLAPYQVMGDRLDAIPEKGLPIQGRPDRMVEEPPVRQFDISLK
jgi:hypothetical protein